MPTTDSATAPTEADSLNANSYLSRFCAVLRKRGLQVRQRSAETESMDTELRNGLWSATYAVYFAEKTQYRFEPASALRA
jgi:hypothetical protein